MSETLGRAEAVRAFYFRGELFYVRYAEFSRHYPKTTFDDFTSMTDGDVGALMVRRLS